MKYQQTSMLSIMVTFRRLRRTQWLLLIKIILEEYGYGVNLVLESLEKLEKTILITILNYVINGGMVTKVKSMLSWTI